MEPLTPRERYRFPYPQGSRAGRLAIESDPGRAREPRGAQARPFGRGLIGCHPRRYNFLPMPTVELTSHLYAFFPDLRGRTLHVEAATVAGVVQGMEALAPGFAFYVCDELGRLRQHVNIFVGDERVSDRTTLRDPVDSDARVLILQALSGG